MTEEHQKKRSPAPRGFVLNDSRAVDQVPGGLKKSRNMLHWDPDGQVDVPWYVVFFTFK